MNYMTKKQKQFESIIPGTPAGVKVVRSNDRADLSFALRKWKKMLKDAGTIEELKDRTTYEKPTMARHKQRERSKYLAQRATERYS
jgi:ribosomal protein S21